MPQHPHPHLTSIPGDGGINLRIHPSRPQAPLSAPASQEWTRVDGGVWIQRHDLIEGSLLRLPGLADFLVDAGGRCVDAWPEPALDADACRQLYLNNILPMAQSRQGMLVLHASAVLAGDGALVFIGTSGRGKSTLATHFANNGHALLVDDGLVVETGGDTCLAMPGERAVRLWQDSEAHLAAGNPWASTVGYTGKRRIPGGDGLRFSPEPLPVHAVFVLGDDPRAPLRIQPLHATQAAMQLVHYSFLLDVGDPRRHAAQLRRIAALVARCRVARLDYPRDYAQLPLVRRAILDHLAG